MPHLERADAAVLRPRVFSLRPLRYVGSMRRRAGTSTPRASSPGSAPPGSPTPSVLSLTLRSVVSGMLIGGVLSLCNIYSGLKVGFTTNMSIAAALLGYGAFFCGDKLFGSRPLGLQENTISQTAASAAASIAGAGLVAPLPALTMLTGRELAYGWLATWAFSVSIIGVLVGAGLRRRMIEEEGLPFPYGMATAELLAEMYNRGREALLRASVLIGAMVTAAAAKLTTDLLKVGVWFFPGLLRAQAAGAPAVQLSNLGFGLDPSVLMVGVGGLIGLRAALSLAGGALLAWLGLSPWLIARGWVQVAEGAHGAVWFGELTAWLLWPGVSMMVAAALTSFLLGRRPARAEDPCPENATSFAPTGGAQTRKVSLWSGYSRVTLRLWLLGMSAAGLLSVWLQLALFDIPLYAATMAVVLSLGLAIVAGRVSGETGIAPIGAMGKVTQLIFALVNPHNPVSNLMAANVTGGSASQCSDLLHDLKTGSMVQARPREQVMAQLFGVLSGALCGSAAYLLLVPDPASQLITAEWPAPAVAQWKAVAEVFSQGVEHLPPGAPAAALLGAILGVVSATLDARLPAAWARFVPSAASVGLSFVLPAYYALSVLLGASLVALGRRWAPRKTARFAHVIAAGLIAGESLSGVVMAVYQLAER